MEQNRMNFRYMVSDLLKLETPEDKKKIIQIIEDYLEMSNLDICSKETVSLIIFLYKKGIICL